MAHRNAVRITTLEIPSTHVSTTANGCAQQQSHVAFMLRGAAAVLWDALETNRIMLQFLAAMQHEQKEGAS
jgi:hypothetical protein